MRKPNSSRKARKAAIARGKKRSDRAKETQATKHTRNAEKRNLKKKEAFRFQQHMENLLGQ